MELMKYPVFNLAIVSVVCFLLAGEIELFLMSCVFAWLMAVARR